MERLFAWRLLVLADDKKIEGFGHTSTKPVTDDEIKREIDLMHYNIRMRETADKVSIFLLALLDDPEELYLEPLDPYIFWPNSPEIIGREYRDIVRDTKSRKKGGEN